MLPGLMKALSAGGKAVGGVGKEVRALGTTLAARAEPVLIPELAHAAETT